MSVIAVAFSTVDDGTAVDLLARPRLHEDVSWIEIDREIVAVHAGRETVHLISATGALLWPFLDGKTSVTALAEDIAAVFDLSPEDALSDVSRFVAQMKIEQLVVLNTAILSDET